MFLILIGQAMNVNCLLKFFQPLKPHRFSQRFHWLNPVLTSLLAHYFERKLVHKTTSNNVVTFYTIFYCQLQTNKCKSYEVGKTKRMYSNTSTSQYLSPSKPCKCSVTVHRELGAHRSACFYLTDLVNNMDKTRVLKTLLCLLRYKTSTPEKGRGMAQKRRFSKSPRAVFFIAEDAGRPDFSRMHKGQLKNAFTIRMFYGLISKYIAGRSRTFVLVDGLQKVRERSERTRKPDFLGEIGKQSMRE